MAELRMFIFRQEVLKLYRSFQRISRLAPPESRRAHTALRPQPRQAVPACSPTPGYGQCAVLGLSDGRRLSEGTGGVG